MALLVEAVDGRGEKKTHVELFIHRPNLYLWRRKQKKNLVSASFQFFPLLFKKRKKRGLQQWKWDKNKKKGLWRLESSTLPCVSFRALECLNQCRRQLEAVGDELQGGGPASSLSPGSYMDRSAHSYGSYELYQLLILQQCTTSEIKKDFHLPLSPYTSFLFHWHNVCDDVMFIEYLLFGSLPCSDPCLSWSRILHYTQYRTYWWCRQRGHFQCYILLSLYDWIVITDILKKTRIISDAINYFVG